MRTKFLWLFLFIAPLALSITSCDDDSDDMEISMLDALEADDRFSTLVSALEQTGLDATVDFLDETTLFAPTDDAFAASGIDLGSLTDDQLANVLLYHLAVGNFRASDIPSGQTYISSLLSGPDDSRPGVSILVENSGGITINGIDVIDPDLTTDKGVIHAIDGVLLPLDIVGQASTNSNFEQLVGALGLASEDLVSVLQGEGPFTVFAPVNQAFLLSGHLQELSYTSTKQGKSVNESVNWVSYLAILNTKS